MPSFGVALNDDAFNTGHPLLLITLGLYNLTILICVQLPIRQPLQHLVNSDVKSNVKHGALERILTNS